MKKRKLLVLIQPSEIVIIGGAALAPQGKAGPGHFRRNEGHDISYYRKVFLAVGRRVIQAVSVQNAEIHFHAGRIAGDARPKLGWNLYSE
jgi:hypothetical protein